MISRVLGSAGLALIISTCVAVSSIAAERSTFNMKAFVAAQAQGKSILVDISAPWCPTCAAQKPIIEKFAGEQKFENLKIFDVDFDSRKDVLRRFGAQSQSTLIVFKGAQETGRSVGSTDPAAIGTLLDKAL